MEYMSAVIRLIFPSGCAYVVIGQPQSLSMTLGVCKSQYQGLVPVNCKKTKFVTHVWRVERL